jgi:hypothetical protein
VIPTINKVAATIANNLRGMKVPFPSSTWRQMSKHKISWAVFSGGLNTPPTLRRISNKKPPLRTASGLKNSPTVGTSHRATGTTRIFTIPVD